MLSAVSHGLGLPRSRSSSQPPRLLSFAQNSQWGPRPPPSAHKCTSETRHGAKERASLPASGANYSVLPAEKTSPRARPCVCSLQCLFRKGPSLVRRCFPWRLENDLTSSNLPLWLPPRRPCPGSYTAHLLQQGLS